MYMHWILVYIVYVSKLIFELKMKDKLYNHGHNICTHVYVPVGDLVDSVGSPDSVVSVLWLSGVLGICAGDAMSLQ